MDKTLIVGNNIFLKDTRTVHNIGVSRVRKKIEDLFSSV